MKGKPTLIDLFSGPGGMSLGFKMAGFKILAAADSFKPAKLTYLNNHGKIPFINNDIRKIEASEIMETANVSKFDLDVLAAGIPCEGFSLLNRKRNGNDPRNYLFKEFVRIAKYLKPKSVIIENVSGLTSMNNGSFKMAITKELSKIGYKSFFSTLNAASFGVPQFRERIFFVGFLDKNDFSFPRPTHYIANQKSIFLNLEPYVTVNDAISDLPYLKSNEEKNHYKSKPKNNFQKSMRKKSKILYNHRAPDHPEDTVKMISKIKPGKSIYPKFKQRIRLDPIKPSPTVVSGGVRPQWFYAHPNQNRGLSVRECARLQSFPDKFVFMGGMVSQRVQVGDAVPPLLAKSIAQQIKKTL